MAILIGLILESGNSLSKTIISGFKLAGFPELSSWKFQVDYDKNLQKNPFLKSYYRFRDLTYSKKPKEKWTLLSHS